MSTPHQDDLQSALGLRLHVEQLSVLQVERCEIVETLNDYPRLNATLAVGEAAGLALQAIGQGVECSLANESAVFSGVLSRIDCFQRAGYTQVEILAEHALARIDHVRHDRIFGEGSRVEIRQLAPFTDFLRFREVSGADVLTAYAEALVQSRETDWDFTLRVAHLCGAYLLVNGNGASLVKVGSASDPVTLTENDVQGLFVTRARITARASSHQWDRVTGTLQGPKELELPDGGDPLRASLKSTSWPGALFGTTPLEDPCLSSAEIRATNELGSELSNAFQLSLQVRLNAPRVSVGDLLELPASSGFHGESFRVERKRLVLDPSGESIYLDCILSDAIPRRRAAAVPHSVLWLGRVTRAAQRSTHGRIRARFSQHQDEAGDSADTSVQCDLLQPFAGAAGGSSAGNWLPPNVDDWVVALAQPGGTGVPLILGALYRGNAAADAVTMADTNRVLFALQQARVEFEGQSGALLLSVLQDGGKGSSLRLSSDGIHLTSGDQQSPKTVKLSSGGLIIDAGTEVHGTLDVK